MAKQKLNEGAEHSCPADVMGLLWTGNRPGIGLCLRASGPAACLAAPKCLALFGAFLSAWASVLSQDLRVWD